MALTDAGSELLLKTLVGATTTDGKCYLGLLDSNGTEISGGGYVRALLVNGSSVRYFTISGSTLSNDRDIAFHECETTSEEGWGEIASFAIFTAETGGTKYLSGAVTSSSGGTVTITKGQCPVFKNGQLRISIS